MIPEIKNYIKIYFSNLVIYQSSFSLESHKKIFPKKNYKIIYNSSPWKFIDLPYIKYSNKRKKLFPTCKKITYLNVNNIDKKKFNNIYKLPKFNDIDKHFLYILNHFKKINTTKGKIILTNNK